MLDFLINNKEYEIQANNQLATILSQFDADYIIDVIDDTMTRRLNSFELVPAPNAVEAFENNFKALKEIYSFDLANIEDTRHTAYREVIRIISTRFNLQFEEQEYLDLYTMAYYLYDFFVSRFNNYLVTFYDRFIEKEKYNIYSNFSLEEKKRNKDSATAYSKLIFGSDEAIALIVANLPYVLSCIKNLPVTDHDIYTLIYGDNVNAIQLFEENITPVTGIFGIFNNILFNEYMYPTVITHIRMAIQMSHQVELKEAGVK